MTAADLVGREREIQALAGLIDLRLTAGRAIVVLGDPGIGKSALLGVAESMARTAGFRVLSATGIESEAHFPFAGLHQLLHPVLDSVSCLRPAHRRALLSAFGLSDGPRPELFLTALAAVSLLAAVARDQPVLVAADDIQWLDPQSAEVLAFAARRASPGPVVIIGAARTGHPSPYLTAGLPVIELHGLDDAAAAELLRRSAGKLSGADRLRIQREAQGNPLALLELPAAWYDREMSVAAVWPPPALSARLERAFAGRLTELPPLTRDAVLAAAVDPVTELTEILAAASRLSGSPLAAEAFGPAADAGLLRTGDGHVLFRHPLVRSGILQSETLARRQAAHAALAAVLSSQPYRRTWHRSQSIVGPDDQIADELEANVAVALGRGAVMTAIADLQRSAQLTSVSGRRGHRLLMAAEHAFGLGRADLLDQLLRQAGRTDLSELDSARMQWLREIFNDGVPGDTTRVFDLCDVARRSAQAHDRDLALNLLLGAALRCWWADTGPAARAHVVEVTQGIGGAGDPRYVAALAVAEPVAQCGAVMGLLDAFESRPIADPDALRLLGMAAHAVGDPVRGVDLLHQSETMLREQGRLGLLSQVLSMQVIDRLELGDWEGATAAAHEGQRVARDTGQPIWSTGTLVCQAMVNAFSGQRDAAFTRAAEVELTAGPQRLNDLLACVQLVRGSALAAAGQYGAAYGELRRMFEPGDPSFHQRECYGGLMFLAETAVPAGRRNEACEVVAALEPVAAVTPSPMLHVYLRFARAVLADDSVAAEPYAALMGQDLSRWPFARARGQLAYGSWLRRQQRYAEARAVLREATIAFTGIGAAVWADRARSELSAAAATKPSLL